MTPQETCLSVSSRVGSSDSPKWISEDQAEALLHGLAVLLTSWLDSRTELL